MSTRDAIRIADRYDRSIEELEADAIFRLDTALDTAYRDLEKQLSKSYSELQTQGGLVASQRRAIIFDELGELLQLVRPEQAGQYEDIYNDLLSQTSASGSTMADELIAAIDSEWPIAQFARIPIEAVALQARDGVKRLSRHSEDFASRASAIVEQGLIQGWGVRRVQDNIRRELGTTKGKAEAIARTETSSALNDAAQQRYRDNGIEYFQLIVTPSESLCPYCAARNGKVYAVGKMRVPLHPSCRCLTAPFSKSWQEKGLTDDEFIKDYRDRGLALLKADGQKPNFGPTYWEKKAGLTSAPRSVWTPGSKPRKRKPEAPKTKQRPQAASVVQPKAATFKPRFSTEVETINYYRKKRQKFLQELEKLPPSNAQRISSLEKQRQRLKDQGKASQAKTLTRDINKLKKQDARREELNAQQADINADLKRQIKYFFESNQKEIASSRWHSMAEDEIFVKTSFGGIAIYTPSIESDAAQETLARLIQSGWPPDALTKHTTTIVFANQRNKDDLYWQEQYNLKGFVSGATGGDGQIVAYNNAPLQPSAVRHEAGHNLAQAVYGHTTPPASSDYASAASSDGEPLTSYGATNLAEDFAETTAIYLETGSGFNAKDLRELNPERHAIMKKLLGPPPESL